MSPAPRHLLVCDLDGTLVDADGVVATGAGEALSDLQTSGVLFAVCTGRPYASARRLLGRARLHPDVLAAYHGALVVDLDRRACVRHLRLPPAVAASIAAELEHCGLDVTWYRGAWRLRGDRADPPTGRAGAAQRAATRILAVGPEATIDAAASRLGALDVAVARIDRPTPQRLDVRHRLALKEEALRLIADRRAVPLDRVTACGDDRSDLGMLRIAGHSVVVGAPTHGFGLATDATLPMSRLAAYLRGQLQRDA